MNKTIPAIKSSIGDWTYYTTSLSFKEVSQLVDKMTDEIYQSSSLKEALQRNITDNYMFIEQYIESQPERFFNSLVLAIYDGEPKWIQVELDLEEEIFHNVGFLKLSGNEHIFPVDGQHRVEGIKAVLKKPANQGKFENEKIPVVFIGHKKTKTGMERSRRLFNTLNRYAKPVSQSDIVILDEDDVGAITTRFLIEETTEVNLFKGNRLDDSLQKAINVTNKKAFTSLIALYECNEVIMKFYFKKHFINDEKYKEYKEKYFSNKTKDINYDNFKRYRPEKETLDKFMKFAESYWKKFENSFECIKEYLASKEESPASKYRQQDVGGNILFRPIGIVPFVEATLKLVEKNDAITIDDAFVIFHDKVQFSISEIPWKNVIWSPQDKTMLSAPKAFIRNMFLYLLKIDNILTEYENESLKEKYAKFIAYGHNISDKTLEELFTC